MVIVHFSVPSLFWVIFVLTFSHIANGQDPANGWLGYAKGVNPSGNGRITYIEAKWYVLNDPVVGGAFFSPWFGIESSDNLNLIQPVNPWVGDEWQIYNEYFQWEPVHNYNSASHTVSAGDLLFGSCTFNPNNQTYTVYHSDVTSGWSVTSNIAVQKRAGDYKNYTIAYFVFEKPARCSQYPPDGKVTFFDILIQYDGQTVTPSWTTSYVDNVCNNRASVINSTTIEITWDTN